MLKKLKKKKSQLVLQQSSAAVLSTKHLDAGQQLNEGRQELLNRLDKFYDRVEPTSSKRPVTSSEGGGYEKLNFLRRPERSIIGTEHTTLADLQLVVGCEEVRARTDLLIGGLLRKPPSEHGESIMGPPSLQEIGDFIADHLGGGEIFYPMTDSQLMNSFIKDCRPGSRLMARCGVVEVNRDSKVASEYGRPANHHKGEK